MCVNAGGIPTVAYQVLHVLSCPWGVPHPCREVPPVWDTPRQTRPGYTPRPRLAGVPPVWTWPGYPPPPPPHRCGQTENITLPHPSDAVGKDTVSSFSCDLFTQSLNGAGTRYGSRANIMPKCSH